MPAFDESGSIYFLALFLFMERPPQTISFYRRRLPHWTVSEGLYFVTLRQKNSIPANAAQKIKDHLLKFRDIDGTELVAAKRKILVEMEKWLDQPHKDGLFINTGVPEIIKEAIDFRSEQGVWRMIEYVIMPNHLHLFFEIRKGSLRKILIGFKRKTCQEIRKLNGSDDEVWQREWFDHWSRSPSQDMRIRKYIRNNPVKAKLVVTSDEWPHGSW